MAKVTKSSVTVSVMLANADRPMAEVVELIVKAQADAGFPEVTAKIAAGAYRYFVKNGQAPGSVESTGRNAKVSLAPVGAAKTEPKVKAPKAKPETKAQRQATLKSPDEIAKIKAANLERMRAVTAKTKKYNQVARPEGAGVPNFDPAQARAEVDSILAGVDELPSFRNPESLTADEVRALV